ncbi:hypothetical protein [Streptomyces sp. NPDC006551]|uniref:hypothetical protein n=1 Tax=Streptomyces sp. NPDC006551 TaxID=3157178 RepID=UPI0033A0F9C1
MVRRRLRLAATLTVVVLALTGFQTSSSGGKSSGKSRGGSSGDSGGGCSSSKKKNDDYDYDDTGSGSGGEYTSEPTVTATSSPTSDFEVVVVDCVKPAQKKRKGKPARKADTTATLEITSRATATETVKVTLRFRAPDQVVDTVDKVVTVEPGATTTFDVAMAKPKTVDRVEECEVWRVGRP